MLWPRLYIKCTEHIEAETRWPPGCWRYFQIHFLVWKLLYVWIHISLKFVPQCRISFKPAMSQIFYLISSLLMYICLLAPMSQHGHPYARSHARTAIRTLCVWWKTHKIFVWLLVSNHGQVLDWIMSFTQGSMYYVLSDFILGTS